MRHTMGQITGDIMDLSSYLKTDLITTSEIKFEDDTPISSKAGISMLDAVSSTEEYRHSLFIENIYIICERKNFRTDALLNMFSGEYSAKVVYTLTDGIPQAEDPLCFVIDVNFADKRTLQKVLVYIQDIAFEKNKHIFLIGEPEELQIARSHFTRKDIAITQFARPIDIKQCTEEIKNIIATPPAVKRKKHIMVCDDSTTICKLLRRTLEPHYKVSTANSAFDFIALLTSAPEPPDMLIIDYYMPVVNGALLLEMIKQKEEYRDIAVAFYTGNSDVNEMISVMPLIDGYILKDRPVTRIEKDLENIFKKKKEERKFKKEKKKKKDDKKGKNKEKNRVYDDKGFKDGDGLYTPYNA